MRLAGNGFCREQPPHDFQNPLQSMCFPLAPVPIRATPTSPQNKREASTSQILPRAAQHPGYVSGSSESGSTRHVIPTTRAPYLVQASVGSAPAQMPRHAPGASRRHVSLECVTTSARRATGVWRRPRAARSAARPWPQRTPCAANGPCRACSPGVSARFPRWPWSCRRGRAARRRPRAAGHGRGRQGACGSDARVRVVLRRHLRERELGFGGHCGGRKIPSVGLGARGLTPPTLPSLLRC